MVARIAGSMAVSVAVLIVVSLLGSRALLLSAVLRSFSEQANECGVQLPRKEA